VAIQTEKGEQARKSVMRITLSGDERHYCYVSFALKSLSVVTLSPRSFMGLIDA
jgi:hypothetical protein